MVRRGTSGVRCCFVLHLRPDRVDEYIDRHRSVWPEMLDALRASGWSNYSLFVEPGGLLVGYVDCDDFAAARAAMGATEVNRRWQESMAEFFVDTRDQAPDEAMVPLAEIFHLD